MLEQGAGRRAMRRIASWRLLWLLPATLLLAGAYQQGAEHRAVLARVRLSPFPRAKVPPTVYTEHSGMAVALACLGVVFVILALRRQRSLA
jgi:hypothetical protein